MLTIQRQPKAGLRKQGINNQNQDEKPLIITPAEKVKFR